MSQHATSPRPDDHHPLGGHGGPQPGPGMYQVQPPSAGHGDNPAGRAALAMAAVTVVVQVIGQVVFHSFLGTGQLSVGGVVSSWFGIGATVFALLALVLGIIGLRKPGAARGAAGVGLGVGAYVLVTGVVGLVANLLHYL